MGGTLGLTSGVIYGIERTQSITSGLPSPTKDGDRMSIATRTSKSSEGKSKSGGGSLNGAMYKIKPKARAWDAPVYPRKSN